MRPRWWGSNLCQLLPSQTASDPHTVFFLLCGVPKQTDSYRHRPNQAASKILVPRRLPTLRSTQDGPHPSARPRRWCLPQVTIPTDAPVVRKHTKEGEVEYLMAGGHPSCTVGRLTSPATCGYFFPYHLPTPVNPWSGALIINQGGWGLGYPYEDFFSLWSQLGTRTGPLWVN